MFQIQTLVQLLCIEGITTYQHLQSLRKKRREDCSVVESAHGMYETKNLIPSATKFIRLILLVQQPINSELVRKRFKHLVKTVFLKYDNSGMLTMLEKGICYFFNTRDVNLLMILLPTFYR